METNKIPTDHLTPVEEIIAGLNAEGMPVLADSLITPTHYLFRDCGLANNTIFSLGLSSSVLIVQRLFEVRPFHDTVVVDLGSGNNPYGYFAAKALGAGAYVAVEPFFTEGIVWNLKEDFHGGFDEIKEMGPEKIPSAVVPEDMLSFLKRLPDDSVSVMCSGIDECILKPAYANEVRKETLRVLSPDGGLLNFASIIHLDLPDKLMDGWPECRVTRFYKK